MAGVTPNEGETVIGNLVYKSGIGSYGDRDADLELGLFTNSTGMDETMTEASITEPSGTGYARLTLTDGSWTITNDTASYAQQTFTGGAGGWTGSVYGYFIATKAAGGTQRLLHFEIDPGGPYTINENDTYKVTPSITVA